MQSWRLRGLGVTWGTTGNAVVGDGRAEIRRVLCAGAGVAGTTHRRPTLRECVHWPGQNHSSTEPGCAITRTWAGRRSRRRSTMYVIRRFSSMVSRTTCVTTRRSFTRPPTLPPLSARTLSGTASYTVPGYGDVRSATGDLEAIA